MKDIIRNTTRLRAFKDLMLIRITTLFGASARAICNLACVVATPDVVPRSLSDPATR